MTNHYGHEPGEWFYGCDECAPGFAVQSDESGGELDIEAIRARHDAWYGTEFGCDLTESAEWHDDLRFVESYALDHKYSPRQGAMAHEIVREDVPELLAEVERLRDLLADAWDQGVRVGWGMSGEGWNGEYPGDLDPLAEANTPNPYRKDS